MLQNNQGASWVVIAVCFVFFWPVGLFLLIKKLGTDRGAQLKGGTTLLVIGGILGLVGLSSLSSSLGRYGSFGGFIMSLFYIAGAALLLRKGLAMQKDSKRYRQYIPLVVNQGVHSVAQLSGATGVAVGQVRTDLQYMVGKGLFPGAWFDPANDAIVMPAPAQPAYAAPASPTGGAYASPQAAPAPRVVQCKNCGANNSVFGAVGSCEYCGTPLA